jgi:transcriptional regulator with XRE-family HTH domain
MSQGGMHAIPQLKNYRKAADLSQLEAAQKVGVTRETWARWELGHRKIARSILPTVAEKTGIPPRELRPDLAELMGDQ